MTSDGPYVGLDYFREEDADMFFGRDAERRLVIANLQASRLTLLSGPSGVGKTSLLRAGVAAQLRELSARERAPRRYLPVVFSAWLGDPEHGLVATLAESASHPDVARADGLDQALEAAAELSGATPLVILDEFQDRFLYADGDGFEVALARCISRADLPAHFLLSVREDAYAQIGQRFKALIPNVYANFLLLDSLDAPAAREATLSPVEAFNARSGAHYAVEPALVDRVVDGVRRDRIARGGDGSARRASGHIEAAFLQLVMRRVWHEEVAAGSELLRLTTLERLGGVQTIVSSHLDDAMAKLSPEQRDVAAEALRFLVTPSGRRIALADADMSEFAQVPGEVLAPALDRLERERILRRVAVPGADAARELFHDVLAPAVLDWRGRHAEERRRAESERRLAALERRNRRMSAAVVVLLAALLAVGAYALNPDALRRLELATVDARFRLGPALGPHSDVALVGMDDQSIEWLQEQRLTLRQGYARLIQQVDATGPRAIAVDTKFDATGKAGTEELVRAISATRAPVVLAFWTFTAAAPSEVGKPPQLQVPLLDTTLTDLSPDCRDRAVTAAWLGYNGLPTDPDNRERRLEAVAPATDRLNLCPFPVSVAARVHAVDADRLRTAHRRAWRGQTDRTAWINFRGPPGTFAAIPARSLLTGQRRDLRGKVVVIGGTATGEDLQRTPYRRPMVGAEAQANAIATILDGAPLRDVPLFVDLLAIFAMTLVAPLAALKVHPRAWVAAAVVAAAAVFLLAAWLAFRAGWVVAIVTPLVALIVATAATGVVALALRRLRNA